MTDWSSKQFRVDMEKASEAIHALCSQRIPKEIFRFTLSQMRMIRCIYMMTGKSEDGILLKQLANELEITPAATSEMVDTLVNRGALARRSNPHDRRAVSIRLSDEWNERFLTYEKQIDIMIDNFFTSIPENERQVTTSVMSKLVAYLTAQESLPKVNSK